MDSANTPPDSLGSVKHATKRKTREEDSDGIDEGKKKEKLARFNHGAGTFTFDIDKKPVDSDNKPEDSDLDADGETDDDEASLPDVIVPEADDQGATGSQLAPSLRAKNPLPRARVVNKGGQQQAGGRVVDLALATVSFGSHEPAVNNHVNSQVELTSPVRIERPLTSAAEVSKDIIPTAPLHVSKTTGEIQTANMGDRLVGGDIVSDVGLITVSDNAPDAEVSLHGDSRQPLLEDPHKTTTQVVNSTDIVEVAATQGTGNGDCQFGISEDDAEEALDASGPRPPKGCQRPSSVPASAVATPAANLVSTALSTESSSQHQPVAHSTLPEALAGQAPPHQTLVYAALPIPTQSTSQQSQTSRPGYPDASERSIPQQQGNPSQPFFSRSSPQQYEFSFKAQQQAPQFPASMHSTSARHAAYAPHSPECLSEALHSNALPHQQFLNFPEPSASAQHPPLSSSGQATYPTANFVPLYNPQDNAHSRNARQQHVFTASNPLPTHNPNITRPVQGHPPQQQGQSFSRTVDPSATGDVVHPHQYSHPHSSNNRRHPPQMHGPYDSSHINNHVNHTGAGCDSKSLYRQPPGGHTEHVAWNAYSQGPPPVVMNAHPQSPGDNAGRGAMAMAARAQPVNDHASRRAIAMTAHTQPLGDHAGRRAMAMTAHAQPLNNHAGRDAVAMAAHAQPLNDHAGRRAMAMNVYVEPPSDHVGRDAMVVDPYSQGYTGYPGQGAVNTNAYLRAPTGSMGRSAGSPNTPTQPPSGHNNRGVRSINPYLQPPVAAGRLDQGAMVIDTPTRQQIPTPQSHANPSFRALSPPTRPVSPPALLPLTKRNRLHTQQAGNRPDPSHQTGSACAVPGRGGDATVADVHQAAEDLAPRLSFMVIGAVNTLNARVDALEARVVERLNDVGKATDELRKQNAKSTPQARSPDAEHTSPVKKPYIKATGYDITQNNSENPDHPAVFKTKASWPHLRTAVRELFKKLLGIRSYKPEYFRRLPPPLTPTEIEEYEKNDVMIPCTVDDFRIDLSKPWASFFLNETARQVFLDYFMKCWEDKLIQSVNIAPGYVTVAKVAWALDKHLDHVKEKYSEFRRDVPLGVLMEDSKKKAQGTRKDHLLRRRLEVCRSRPRLFARHEEKVFKYMMQRSIVSGDETDPDVPCPPTERHPNPARVFRIIRPEWRSDDLSAFMHMLDDLYIDDYKNPIGRRRVPGNPPRTRVKSSRSEVGVVPKGLYRNFYNPNFLTSLNRAQREKLNIIDEDFDLSTP
ncbi:hypothetical protein CONPUDRAFT_156836 [Coniophora puteana RWD-64-598 SS2]|uniref:Uncharacterized protein n=1 Tax=Coniophora puteana (strain RWD-64-598) TaxID=741705 RepID=A0A5M3MF55_CONPW|nr:uncharacterized protein CONPUDRAFT_156836 [Coniophora puteana RWD-64-598 SS2]EIW77636.1 hypothetical protein CONPUDRAFT_156836 [Coniophora puteana RWD-64-598 SS2]